MGLPHNLCSQRPNIDTVDEYVKAFYEVCFIYHLDTMHACYVFKCLDFSERLLKPNDCYMAGNTIVQYTFHIYFSTDHVHN